ncbi:glycolate oxidase [Ilyonectria destructans]|nr:glycolate oxidase [Ilyonectria destructans]
MPGPPKYQDGDLQAKHDELFHGSAIRGLPTVLPDSCTKARLEQTLAELITIVGEDGVFTGASLSEYIDPFQLMEGENHVPSAAVCPDSVEKLQAVLKVANKFRIPLWTCSRGKNLGYGGPAPRVSGSIVLDLHRMNSILEVNENFAYAVVEPGVTFFDLYNYCRSNNVPLWPSVPTLGWGSVLGNTVDRGFGYTPLGDHHQHICGMEVVLANGEVVRTGQFAISNAKTAHLSKLSFGPSIEGLFLQSNLGVVTKLGIWLYPQPQSFMSCTLDMDEPEDIGVIVDVLGSLRRQDILQNNPVIRNIVALSSASHRLEDIWTGQGPIPRERLRHLQQKIDIGYWRAQFGLYGPSDLVKERFKIIEQKVNQDAPAARLRCQHFEGTDGEPVDAESIPSALGGGQVGVPNMWALPMVQYRCKRGSDGIGAHTDFSPILPASGKDVLEWFLAAKNIHETEGVDIYCGGHLHARHMIMINMMVIDKTKLQQEQACTRVFGKLAKEAKRRGISKYRSHLRDMDTVADMYDFNNHAYQRFVQELKEKLDPNGILSPGKQGIWPKGYRKPRNGAGKL